MTSASRREVPSSTPSGSIAERIVPTAPMRKPRTESVSEVTSISATDRISLRTASVETMAASVGDADDRTPVSAITSDRYQAILPRPKTGIEPDLATSVFPWIPAPSSVDEIGRAHV